MQSCRWGQYSDHASSCGSGNVLPIRPHVLSLLNPLEKGCRVRVAAGSVGLSTPEVNVRLPGALTVRPASEPFVIVVLPLLQIGSLADEGRRRDGLMERRAGGCAQAVGG